MNKNEALRLALEALETLHDENMDYLTRNKLGGENNQCMVFAREAITAIKAALEAKDEPWEQFYPEMGKPKLAYLPPTESLDNVCYIPPQRTWVGLTDEEMQSIAFESADALSAVFVAEAKLRSKNNG